MTNELKRVLIVADEEAVFFALGDYLTFRGLRVDSAEGADDARALARHLAYDAIVVGTLSGEPESAYALVRELRREHPHTRVLLVAGDAAAHSPDDPVDEPEPPRAFTAVEEGVELGKRLPVGRLAKLLCHSIAA